MGPRLIGLGKFKLYRRMLDIELSHPVVHVAKQRGRRGIRDVRQMYAHRIRTTGERPNVKVVYRQYTGN